MEKNVAAVLNLIKELQIENEIRAALAQESPEAKVEEMPVTPLLPTVNGFQPYFDDTTGKAVGIVYKNMVFLAETSAGKMSWEDAVRYCKSIVINGITARLCPITEKWESAFKIIYPELRQALLSIGAEEVALNSATWCERKDRKDAWKMSFNNGHISRAYIAGGNFSYVRPVLILRNK